MKKRIIAFSLVFVLALVGLLGLGAESKIFSDLYRPSPLKGRETNLRKVQSSFHNIFEAYKHKVVYISTEKEIRIPANPFINDPFFRRFFVPMPKFKGKRTHKLTGLGTGFIISKDGYVCTNYHVIQKVDKVRVRVGKKEYNADVIGSDPLTDIALLKVKNASNFEPVYFGDSDKVRVGDWAIAIGNPFGFDETFTVGVVSAVRVDVEDLGGAFIQTDASINKGNSGGPLLNIDGEVVGVNRAIWSVNNGGNSGISFSIPINTVRAVLEQLHRHGKVKWGYVGVKVYSLTRGLARHLGAKNTKGALIDGIVPGGPADKAGLEDGDLILRIDGLLIKDANHLSRTVSRIPVGKKIKFEILRGKKPMMALVTIGEKP